MYMKSIITVLVILAIWECAIWAYRLHLKSSRYQMAVERAQLLGRPLMVIGDPEGGFTDVLTGGRSYGYGDVTLDIHVSADCPNPVEGDLAVTLPEFADDSHVIFSCYTFEYIKDLATLIPHVYRVAGDAKNIFVVSGGPYALVSWFEAANFMLPYPASTNVITGAPPTQPTIEFFKKPF